VLIAFGLIAIAAVMPVVAADLGGMRWYALAFATPMAVSVLALALAGPWMDRRGVFVPVLVGAVLFAGGLALCGVAPGMAVFLAGRAVYGFGAGLLQVAMFVIVARCYPPPLRPAMFALYTSTFMTAALAGPAVAGAIAEHFGWRWVFLLVPVLAAVAVALLVPALRSLDGRSSAPFDRAVPTRAAVAGLGILALSAAGPRTVPGWPVLLAAAVLAVIAAVPRLLPAGTWRFRPGLPATLAMRGLAGAGFLSIEQYMPLALTEFRHCPPTLAGTALTVSSVMWFVGAWLCARPRLFNDIPARLRIGLTLGTAGLASVLLLLVDGVPLWLVLIGWGIGALGLGMTLPTLAVTILNHSAADTAGANSTYTHLNDAVSQAVTLAVGGVAWSALLPVSPAAAFAAVLGLSLLLCAAAVVPMRRLAVR